MEKNIEILEKLKKVENINYIGDELKFERKYYNYLHNTNLRVDIRDSTESAINNYISSKLNKKYKNLLETNFSLEVINTIENNDYTIFKKKGENISKKTVYSPDTHYLKIFIMLKFYGFLNDYNIFKLLEKYNINPKNEEMKKEVEIIKQKCKIEYEEDNNKLPFSLKSNNIVVENGDIINFWKTDLSNMIFLSNIKNNERYIRAPIRAVNLKKFKEYMLNKFELLSTYEKRCKSLDFGKETYFIDDIIDNKIEFIEFETVKKILEYLGLKKSDMYYFIQKRIDKPSSPYKPYKILGKYDDI